MIKDQAEQKAMFRLFYVTILCENKIFEASGVTIHEHIISFEWLISHTQWVDVSPVYEIWNLLK